MEHPVQEGQEEAQRIISDAESTHLASREGEESKQENDRNPSLVAAAAAAAPSAPTPPSDGEEAEYSPGAERDDLPYAQEIAPPAEIYVSSGPPPPPSAVAFAHAMVPQQQLAPLQPQIPFAPNPFPLPGYPPPTFGSPSPFPSLPPPPPPQIANHPSMALQYYDAQMRGHAAAYANAAAAYANAAAEVARAAMQNPMIAPPPPPPPPPSSFFPQNLDVSSSGLSPMQGPIAQRPPSLEEYTSSTISAMEHVPGFANEEQSYSTAGDSHLPNEEDPKTSRKRTSVPPRVVTTTTRSSAMGRRRSRSDNDSNSSGTPRRQYNSKKQRSDLTIIGKTAIVALYEWCQKRSLQPIFISSEDRSCSQPIFTVNIHLEDDPETQIGTAEGYNIASAKQLAARRAMEQLLPGIVFCANTGVVDSIPEKPTTTPVDSLAHLTKQQLAIGQSPNDSKKRPSSALPKSDFTTTSEDDVQSVNSRGSTNEAILSTLLFDLVAVDSSLPANPSFTYFYDTPDKSRHKIRRGPMRGTYTCTALLQKIQEDGTPTTLEASGNGSGKRQARHAATEKLLALLFPECGTNLQIQAAAEAALKARKTRVKTRKTRDTNPFRKFWRERGLLRPSTSQRNLAPEVQLRLRKRMNLLENSVDSALSQLYDKNSEELTEDDVGRTIFRRASPEDLPRIRTLLDPTSSLADEEDLTLRWWSTASFVLVLCRAIAALEDPPLGAAVLTVGFDLDKGKLLRVTEIGNEKHLPTERLIECLQSFAVCMDTTLILKGGESSTKNDTTSSSRNSSVAVARDWPLQSVQEEEESEASSSSEQRRSLKDKSSKPSKRTRRL